MTDLEPILALWRALAAEGKEYVLATIVDVDGPSYRKPGACMLMAEDGRRAGTVSGGCLEAEVAKRAWWLTEQGPTLQSYSTVADDGEMPYGSGCGGVVHLLLERRATAEPLLAALDAAFENRRALAVATVLDGPRIATRALAGALQTSSPDPLLLPMAEEALDLRRSITENATIDGAEARVWVAYLPARTGLWVFSAGDDAKPLVRMARELGWWVAVADGRSHLATTSRFPAAHSVRVLPIAELPGAFAAHCAPWPHDAAIVMTHSFEQDARILAALLAMDAPPAYIGVLGPQRRTRELLAEVAKLLGEAATAEQVERWLDLLFAPTGLDLAAEAPATVALSILAEAQKVLRDASAEPLRKVRAVPAVALRI
ncbi:MAG TPA: XdhC family protein [Terracidiphilus sp.]